MWSEMGWGWSGHLLPIQALSCAWAGSSRMWDEKRLESGGDLRKYYSVVIRCKGDNCGRSASVTVLKARCSCGGTDCVFRIPWCSEYSRVSLTTNLWLRTCPFLRAPMRAPTPVPSVWIDSLLSHRDNRKHPRHRDLSSFWSDYSRNMAPFPYHGTGE